MRSFRFRQSSSAHTTRKQMYTTVIVPNPAFSKNKRTTIKQSIKDVLEHYFNKQKWPSVEEFALLAESLQLEKKVLRVWFSNRRQKEKKNLANVGTTQIRPPNELDEGVRKINHIERELRIFPLYLSAGNNYGNVKRFSLGKPNEFTQRRTVLVLGTKELIHKKFIDQIINYIVNIKEQDKFHLQVVEEEGQSNCISVYDIHPAEGFRIPYSLTIVVTPYSGECEDSGQLFRDQNVAEMFHEFLEDKDGIKELDMICNVTVKTGQIKQPFLSIFGKDVEENINNWELTADFLSATRSWQAVIRHFFLMLAKMKTKSLLLTKAVLNERKKLEMTVDRLGYLITTVLAKKEEINHKRQEMKRFKEQIKIELIHYNSLLPNLFVPDVPGFFSVSPGPNNELLEHVQRHCNQLLSKDVNRMYQEAEIKRNEIESKGRHLLELLYKDLLDSGSAMKENFDQTWRCIKQLNRIALHGNSFLTQKVFDLLFDAEQHLKQLCFQEKDSIKI